MSFLAKLLIFFGWMMIFSEGIIGSASTKEKRKFQFPFGKVKEKTFRSDLTGIRSVHIPFDPVHYPLSLFRGYTVRTFVCKLSSNGDVSINKIFEGGDHFSYISKHNIFPSNFVVTEAELDEELNFIFAVVEEKKLVSYTFEMVMEKVLDFRKNQDKIIPLRFLDWLKDDSIGCIIHVCKYFSKSDMSCFAKYGRYEDEERPLTGVLSPLRFNITEDDLDKGLDFIVAVISNDEKAVPKFLTYLQPEKEVTPATVTTGTSTTTTTTTTTTPTIPTTTAENHSSGLTVTTIGKIIAVALLHLGSAIVCS